MENITLGQISITIAFIVAFVTGCKFILNEMKKIMDKALKPINDKIDTIEKRLSAKIDATDMNATKNYLVARLKDIRDGDEMDEFSRERFFEQYKHYQLLGGNSYIENAVERLKKEGKL